MELDDALQNIQDPSFRQQNKTLVDSLVRVSSQTLTPGEGIETDGDARWEI